MHDFQKNSFSGLTDLTLVRLFLCTALQQKWHARHLQLENAFPNEKRKQKAYQDFSSYASSEKVAAPWYSYWNEVCTGWKTTREYENES